MADVHARGAVRDHEAGGHPDAYVTYPARGHHGVLRVARTLAELEGTATVACIHIAEALRYRWIALAR